MRRLLLTVCLAASVCLAADPEPEPEPGGDAKSDLKAMQGTWNIVKWTSRGKAAPAAILASKFVIEKDQFNLSREGKAGSPLNQMTIKLDPKKKPPAIDLVNARTMREMKGIYKLAKDELTIVYSPTGKARPAKLDDTADNIVWVLKRDKK